MKNILYFIALSFIVFSCGSSSPSTSVSSSWSKPDANFSLASSSNKVLVVAMTDDETNRRAVEDAYVRHLGNGATPSYAYFKGPISRVNQKKAVEDIQSDGFDAAMVVRLTHSQKSGGSRPTRVGLDPSIYTNFRGNISGGIGISIRPGYDNSQSEYDIETTLYEFPSGDLVWSGMTVAENPKSITSLASDVSNNVFGKMRADGIVR